MAGIDISSGKTILSTGLLQLQNGVAMSSTLTSVTDQSNTASTLKLSTNSAQFTSPLRITTDDPSDFYLDCEDGSTNNRFSITRNTASQQVNLNFASNPAGSTTIVGAIRTYVDGTNLSEVMSFREDGRIGVLNTNPAYTFDVNGTINTRFAFNQDSANANQINGIINQGGANQAVVGINCLRLNAQVSMMVGAAQAPTATLEIKGSGSTSATTSLLVQNSAGSNALKITDDAQSFYYGTFGVVQQHFYSNNGSGAKRWSDSYSIIDYTRGYGDSFLIYGGYTANYTFEIKDGFSTRVRYPLCVSTTFNIPNASAILQADSTTQGFLPPRMTDAQIRAIASPAEGLIAYNTTISHLCCYQAGAWVKFSHSPM